MASTSSALVTILFHTGVVSRVSGSNDLSYSDFLSITLTALSLMITVLGIFVAAASFIGWTTIENKLRDHSVTYFQDQLSKDGKLREEFEQIISHIAYEGIENFKTQRGISNRDNDREDEEYND